jgi:hypothetical protein
MSRLSKRNASKRAGIAGKSVSEGKKVAAPNSGKSKKT